MVFESDYDVSCVGAKEGGREMKLDMERRGG